MVHTPAAHLPSDAELLSIINGSDLLSVAIRGHQCVDAAMNRLLSEALPAPYELEISRLTFGLKVDLAIALQLLRSDSRSLFMAVNKVRNKFAHDPEAVFDAKESTDLGNAFSDFQRYLADPRMLSTAREVLEHAIAVIFAEASSAGNRIQDQKLYDEVMHEMVQDVLKHHVGKSPDEHDSGVQDELQRRFQRRKAAASRDGSGR